MKTIGPAVSGKTERTAGWEGNGANHLFTLVFQRVFLDVQGYDIFLLKQKVNINQLQHKIRKSQKIAIDIQDVFTFYSGLTLIQTGTTTILFFVPTPLNGRAATSATARTNLITAHIISYFI